MGKATGKNTQTNSQTTQSAKSDHYQLSLKVSTKGAVQLDGLRRFPVTLYADEWQAILARHDAIKKFIADNARSLKTKEQAGEDNGAPRTSI